MRSRFRPLLIAALLVPLLRPDLLPAQQEGGYGDRLGQVHVPASACSPEAMPHLERGLALLHHMTYEGAAEEFAAATAADPECALGYWGGAMTYIHPLWSDPPTEEAFSRGVELLERARRIEGLEEWETAWIEAAGSYYGAGHSMAETANLAAFADGWAGVYENWPESPEAAAFHSLSHLATADRGDPTLAANRYAGRIAEHVLRELPEHPGAHHYLIHAYDVPALAEDALEVARHYGTIAPAVPHALHMPSHIFTRLGLWEESIEWNRRSAEAALRHPQGDAVSIHYMHALDYLAYAHLQRAEDDQARQVLRTIRDLDGPFHVEVATPYTLAAVPARLLLERQEWARAAELEPRVPASYPWDRFPAIEAISYFARGLGAARSGNPESAERAAGRLAELRDAAARTSPYWAKQVEIQRLAVLAWARFARGGREAALSTMEEAAALEASTEKHPVTPGEVLPARELLGDMLLELEDHDRSRAAYEAALERSPRRLNALYGAGRAAELAGDRAAATRYYEELVELTADAEAVPGRVQHARELLGSGG